MPNIKSLFREYVTEIEGQNECNFCFERFSKNITRTKIHFIRRCKNLPPNVEKKVRKLQGKGKAIGKCLSIDTNAYPSLPMPKPKSNFRKYIAVIDGKNRCKLCDSALSLNITRNKKHFLNKCKAIPTERDDLEIGSQDSNDGKASASGLTAKRDSYDPDYTSDSNVSLKSSSSDGGGSGGDGSGSDVKPFLIKNSGNLSPLMTENLKQRNANILSAILCLIKELDYNSLEVIDTTIHCRMEEMDE